MVKQLKRVVILTNPETRQAETFRPGESVPGWARKAITNPAAWETSDTEDDQADEPEPEEPETPANDGEDGGSDSDGEEEALPQPARAGRGSSLEAWQAYADARGIEYANDATRDDIIAAVDATES